MADTYGPSTPNAALAEALDKIAKRGTLRLSDVAALDEAAQRLRESPAED